MPVNQHNMSSEVRPLKFLYTKYAPQAKTLYSPVRPLGIVRTESNRDDSDISLPFSDLKEFSDVERVEHFLAMSQDAHSSSMYMELGSNDDQSLTDVPNNGTHLSRSQVFENKYKLVASRTSQDCKGGTNYGKRVIQLPMLKINLETHECEKEENKALETTRKSLRKIIEVGRNGTKVAGIINYKFKTPRQSLNDLNGYASSPITSVRTERSSSKRVVFNYESTHESATSRSLVNNGDLKLESVGDSTVPSKSNSLTEKIILESEDEYYSESDDEKASVMAHRLSSAATLGTARDFIDSQSFDGSCGSDQSNSEVKSKRKKSVHQNNLTERSFESHMWPNHDGEQTVTETDCVQHVLYIQNPRLPKQRIPKGSPVRLSRNASENFIVRNGGIGNGPLPKLNYTLNSSKTKLGPISMSSRSCADCPICHLFQHKETTPCPPNTPRAEGERPTTRAQQPFNKNVLSEIDLSKNLDNSICESSCNSSAHKNKLPTDNHSLTNRMAVEQANHKDASSMHYRFGYMEPSDVPR